MTKFTCFTQKRRQPRLLKPGVFRRFRLNTEKISLAVFLALIISGFAYLALINSVSTQGFELKKLEQKIEVLKEENGKMQLEAAEWQSMNAIVTASEKMNLTVSEKVQYVELSGPAVALGR